MVDPPALEAGHRSAKSTNVDERWLCRPFRAVIEVIQISQGLRGRPAADFLQERPLKTNNLQVHFSQNCQLLDALLRPGLTWHLF